MARQNAQKSPPNPAPKAAPERTEEKKPVATASAPVSKPVGAPTQDQIARRAFEIFQARGGTHGNPEHDWHQAERELKLGRQ